MLNTFGVGDVWLGSPIQTMTRLYAFDGVTLLTTGNVTSVKRSIGVKVNGVWVAGDVRTIPVSSVISGVQVANGWSVDSVGYNFRDVVPASLLATAGLTRIDYVVTTSDGNSVPFVTEANVRDPFSTAV